jgi:hypothetical protein
MTLLECDAFPIGMEIFPATDDDAWTLIRRIIDGCDYYLLVIAGKYGSVDPTSGLSYTEMEYDYAVSSGKPVMAFLHGAVGELRFDLCESTDEGRGKLGNFREKVKKAKHVKFWKSPDELAGQVALTYNRFVRMHPATGWVRADRAASSESLKELLDAKSRIEQLEADLRRAEVAPLVGTRVLAQGTDKVRIPCQVTVGIQKEDSSYDWKKIRVTRTETWDSLFAGIGLGLMMEESTSAFRAAIQSFLEKKYRDDNLKKVAQFSPDPAQMDEPSISISESEFDTIRVQLMALGLIQKSGIRLAYGADQMHWTLTPYGEKRLIQLRAIYKNDDSSPKPRLK